MIASNWRILAVVVLSVGRRAGIDASLPAEVSLADLLVVAGRTSGLAWRGEAHADGKGNHDEKNSQNFH